MRFRNIINYCIDQGWQATRIKGGHLIMTKDGRRSVPIPIHGEGLPEFIIKKELEQEPPKSKQIPELDKENENVEKIAEDISQVNLKAKPIKKPLETDGVEMFPSNEEATLVRQTREKEKDDLLLKAIATFIEEEDFAESAKQFEHLLQNYSQFLSIDERAEINYLLAYSWFFNIWNEKEGSQAYLHAMERTCEVCKNVFTTDQDKSSGIKALMTTIASHLMNMVAEEFTKIAFAKHKKYKNATFAISLLRAFEFFLKQDLDIDKAGIYTACLYLCVEAARIQSKQTVQYYEKGWGFYCSAKANKHLFENFQIVEQLYLQYVLFVVDAYKANKLKGSKYEDEKQVKALINEANKFASYEFVLGSLKFDHYIATNKYPRIGSVLYQDALTILEKFKSIKPSTTAEYLECRMEVYWFQIAGNYEYSEELTQISGTWGKYLECRVEIMKYKELYEKDLAIWKRIPASLAHSYMCPSIPQFEIMLQHYQERIVTRVFEDLHDIWERAVGVLNYIGHNEQKLSRLHKAKLEKMLGLYQKSYSFFCKNKDKVAEMAQKKSYTQEELNLSMDHLYFMIDVRAFGKMMSGIKR